MTEFNIKSKTAGKCRVYPDGPNGLQPSVTSICGALMKYALIDWAANCAVDSIMSHWPKGNDFSVFTQDDYKAFFDEARKAHEQIRDTAADFGTQAHLLCQLWIEGKKDQIEPAQAEYFKTLIDGGKSTDEAGELLKNVITLFDSFCTWAITNNIEPVHTEIVLHGDGYSGRCDLIAYRTDPKTKERKLGLYDIKTGKGSYYPEWGLQLSAYAEACDVYISNYEIQEIGIIKFNKETLKCNFSEDGRGPKFTNHRQRLTEAWGHLVKFYWLYNDLQSQFEEIQNGQITETVS